MPQPQRSSRNKKIEPLSWEVAAQSPALKGMTSFLDIPAEDIRAGRYVGALVGEIGTAKESAPGVVKTAGNEAIPGDETSPEGITLARVAVPVTMIRTIPVPPRAHSFTTEPRVSPALDSPIKDTATSGLASGPAVKVTPARVTATANISRPEYDSPTVHEKYPGGETYTGNASGHEPRQVTPGRGRSKVRRCVLAQDGHSLGEEAIYQVMWRAGRPESQDPNASRTIRIGAADIGFKVNMAKKNVRQNVSRLYEKLALEILEDFETMSSQPRLYRVFSYRQILERRRAVGMEFVLRNKGVVFCTSDGEDIVTSPAYVSTPGDETSIRPAPPKKRRVPMPPPIAPPCAPSLRHCMRPG